jgi:hypothetical protein
MVWRAPARAKWKATHAFLAKHMALRPEANGTRVPSHMKVSP